MYKFCHLGQHLHSFMARIHKPPWPGFTNGTSTKIYMGMKPARWQRGCPMEISKGEHGYVQERPEIVCHDDRYQRKNGSESCLTSSGLRSCTRSSSCTRHHDHNPHLSHFPSPSEQTKCTNSTLLDCAQTFFKFPARPWRMEAACTVFSFDNSKPT